MIHLRRRSSRLLAAALAGALALTASPLLVPSAQAADQLPPLANPIVDGAVCDGAPTTNPFTDLGGETPATRETILCLRHTGITTGKTATTYVPGGTVTRREMAVFIQRLATDLLNKLEVGSLTDLPAYDNDPDYSDVAANDSGAAAIGQLTQAEIVGGFPDGTFRPTAPVSRRQMAAFVNNLQDFLTGNPYSTNGDYFDDDEGDPGEVNLNALASVGIFQGDGQGNVDPRGDLSRRQMANILLRDAQVFFADDLIDSPFQNATYTVTPTTVATHEVATEPATSDDRQYTASGLTAATSYTIQLFPAANVHGPGRYTFTEDGATNTAQEGTVVADISVVNGSAVAVPDDDATATPVNGQITFTIDGVDSESVVPVVYKDADLDGNLDLNSSNGPIAAEPFGVGGVTQFVPPEATGGVPANGTVTLVSGTTLAVLDDADTVYFNAADVYQIGGAAPPFAAATAAVFFQNLSLGDTLYTCTSALGVPAPYTQDAANTWCLQDVAPAEPTALVTAAGSPADTSIELDWTASTTASVTSYKVYSNDETCANTVAAELGLLATVAAPTASYTASGLTPATPYCFVVTAVSGSDESPAVVDSPDAAGDNTAERTTAGAIEPPTVVTATLTTDGVPTGTTSNGDVWTLEFSEAMDLPANATFDLTDVDGDTIRVQCGLVAAGGDNLTSATCALGNGANATANDTVTITLQEAGEDRNAGTGGGGNDLIEYAVKVTDSTIVVDDDDAAEPTYGSGDVTIG